MFIITMYKKKRKNNENLILKDIIIKDDVILYKIKSHQIVKKRVMKIRKINVNKKYISFRNKQKKMKIINKIYN